MTLLQYVRPNQLNLPDEVLSYKRETRAYPLFGLPLAEGCARTPTISGLPTVCERAFEVLENKQGQHNIFMFWILFGETQSHFFTLSIAAIELEGIFRISGSRALVNELKQRFDRGTHVLKPPRVLHCVIRLRRFHVLRR